MRWCYIRKNEGIGNILHALVGRWPILLLAAAGVLLLLFGGSSSGKESDSGGEDYMLAAEEYRQRIEDDVSKLCSRIDGAGEIMAVMVTLESGDEYVWAENVGSGGGVEVVISNKEGLLVERLMPEVRGVTVVCGGGGSIEVKKELTDALCAALGIPSNRIHISAGR